MVEDNPDDERLTLRAFAKNKLTNRIHVVRDGQEALDYVFCTGKYADRKITDRPHVILLDIKLPLIDRYQNSPGAYRVRPTRHLLPQTFGRIG